MLKDLDQRKAEQEGSSNMTVPVVLPTSNTKIISVSIFVIVLFNIIGLFVWQMYVENQALKEATERQKNIAEHQLSEKVITVNDKTTQNLQKGELPTAVINVSNNNSKIQTIEKQNVAAKVEPEIEKNTTSEIASSPINLPKSSFPKRLNSAHEGTAPVTIKQENNIKAFPSKLKISRTQLTPRELAQQNIKRAEQALANDSIPKAESLFEDVLLILPEHKSARKQLAALWFGRKSYTAALNLLSQGIALSPTDSEFRMMQARIYLQQSRNKMAFNVLNGMPQVNDVTNIEYQSLRASIAQQLNEFIAATEAYQLLADIEPATARWWLGLAVAHDSNSKFKQASLAYKKALTKRGLSDNAENFVRQRISELGEQ